MMWNEDYKDILRALSAEQADFILTGAYALAAHGVLSFEKPREKLTNHW